MFGFSPLSLLLPEAIAGVLAVGAALRDPRAAPRRARRRSPARSRWPCSPRSWRSRATNGVDPLLILLLVLACGAGLRACETGRWRTLIWCGVLVGLAFNTKTLAAYLVVPGIAARLPRLRARLAAAGASCSWSPRASRWPRSPSPGSPSSKLTPASKRPYVGSSTNNTELGLTFEYNGFGRVEGQSGGPRHVRRQRPGARVPAKDAINTKHHSKAPTRGPSAAPPPAHRPHPRRSDPSVTHGRDTQPDPLRRPARPLAAVRRRASATRPAGFCPFALFGLLAVALLALRERRRTAARPSRGRAEPGTPRSGAATPGRRDPRLASAIVLGGWFLVEAAVLSLSKGIVHPYYVSALAPGTGAMAGAGAVALVRAARGAAPRCGRSAAGGLRGRGDASRRRSC